MCTVKAISIRQKRSPSAPSRAGFSILPKTRWMGTSRGSCRWTRPSHTYLPPRWCRCRLTGWPFDNAMCKMSGLVQGMSVSASVFTLVAIAVERYVGTGDVGMEPALSVFLCPLCFSSRETSWGHHERDPSLSEGHQALHGACHQGVLSHLGLRTPTLESSQPLSVTKSPVRRATHLTLPHRPSVLAILLP